jgi:hypothetical protein
MRLEECGSFPPVHSGLNAVSGSTFVARRAGMWQAMKATLSDSGDR